MNEEGEVQVVLIAHRTCTAVRSYHFKAILWLNKTKKKSSFSSWLVLKVAEVTRGEDGHRDRQLILSNLTMLFLVSLRESLSVNTLGSWFCNYNKSRI